MSIKKIGGASPIDEGTSADALMRRRMSQSMLRWSARPSKRCSPSFFAQKLSGFYEKIQSIFPFGFAKSCFCAKKPRVCLFARPRGAVRLSGFSRRGVRLARARPRGVVRVGARASLGRVRRRSRSPRCARCARSAPRPRPRASGRGLRSAGCVGGPAPRASGPRGSGALRRAGQ